MPRFTPTPDGDLEDTWSGETFGIGPYEGDKLFIRPDVFEAAMNRLEAYQAKAPAFTMEEQRR